MPDAGYTISITIVSIGACNAPDAAILPTLASIDIHIAGGGQEVPDINLEPSLLALDIHFSSC